MYVIMGGTGHVGSAVADSLLARGEQVTIVTHDAAGASPWRAKGAQVAEANVDDVDSLRAAFRLGRRAFLLNPPAATTLDTDVVERRTVAHILAALEGSGLDKVVAESTAGAQPGERIGDLNVLWELEQGLQRQPIPAAINRAGYYMSNWDPLVERIRETGTLPSMLPAGLALPMVATRDLGEAAAARLVSSTEDVGIRHVEGPERYSAADVAAAFARALKRPVDVVVTPREGWVEAFRQLGFSHEAAQSYARMTGATVDGEFTTPEGLVRGMTTLDDYVRELVAHATVR